MNSTIDDILIGAGLLIAILVAIELGFRAGRRAQTGADPSAGSQVGAIQGALFGLLGLLLAFSFAAAGARFLERQDLIVQEANAIGTAALRADLLDEPHRAELLRELSTYLNHRVALSARLRSGITAGDLETIDALHRRIWAAGIAGVESRPQAMLGVLPPLNEVIDLHSTRMAASRKGLPPVVVGLLIVCSLMTAGVIGFGCGLGGRRRGALTAPLGILIGATLWITMDLDHPRAGLLQLSDVPLQQLKIEAPPE